MSQSKHLITTLAGLAMLLACAGCESSSKTSFTPPDISIEATDGSQAFDITEGSSAVIVFTFSRQLREPVVVNLSITEAGATEDTDFTAQSLAFEIQPSNVSNLQTVYRVADAISDGEDESAESFSVQLDSVSQGRVLVPAKVTFTIPAHVTL